MTVRYVKVKPGPTPTIVDRGTFEPAAKPAESATKKKAKKKASKKTAGARIQKRGEFSADGCIVLLYDDELTRNAAVSALNTLSRDLQVSGSFNEV